MITRWSITAAFCAALLPLACNQSKPKISVVTTEEVPAPKKSDDSSQKIDVIDGNAVELARATVEPKCPVYGPLQPNEFSAKTAAGDILNASRHVYSGFDGKHVYKVPTAVAYILADETATAPNLVTTPPTFVIEDPTVVSAVYVPTPTDLVALPKNWAVRYLMVTAKKAGTTKITYTYNGLTIYSTIHIVSYTPTQYEMGKKRYQTPEQATTTDRYPCGSCHNNPDGLKEGATDHDARIQGTKSDDALKLMTAWGKECNPDGQGGISKTVGYHLWHLTQEELDGMPAYIRSLPAQGF